MAGKLKEYFLGEECKVCKPDHGIHCRQRGLLTDVPVGVGNTALYFNDVHVLSYDGKKQGKIRDCEILTGEISQEEGVKIIKRNAEKAKRRMPPPRMTNY